MSIPSEELRSVSRLLTAYCDEKVPESVRDKLTLGFSVRGSAVTLFERRPTFQRPGQWHEESVARFRYVASTRTWHLYCQFADLKWHAYSPRPTAKRFSTLLREVDADPTCIFFG